MSDSNDEESDKSIDLCKENEEERFGEDLLAFDDEQESCAAFANPEFEGQDERSSILRTENDNVSPLLRKYIEEQDGAIFEVMTQVLTAIGKPADVRHRIGEPQMEAQYCLPPPLNALNREEEVRKDKERMDDEKAVKIRCASKSRSFILAYPELPTGAYVCWEDALEDVYNACVVLESAIGVYGKTLMYKLPRSLEPQLVPLLYAWVTDWEVLVRFSSVWSAVQSVLCQVTRNFRSFLSPPSFHLPHKPLMGLLRSALTLQTRYNRILSVKSIVEREVAALSHACVQYFEAKAFWDLWEAYAPIFTDNSTRASHEVIELFCMLSPFTALSTAVRLGSEEEASEESPLLPVQRAVQYFFAEAMDEPKNFHWRIAALQFAGSLAFHAPGVIDLTPFAEPIFTSMLRLLLRKDNEESSRPKTAGVIHCKNQSTATALASIVFMLPADPTTSLWNQLRRFIHFCRAFIRPNAKGKEAALVAQVYGVMLRNARKRLKRQNMIMGEPNTGAVGGGSFQRPVHLAPSHVWTTETVEALVGMVEDSVFLAFDCSVVRNSIALITEMVWLAPQKVLERVLEKAMAAFEHKSHDMGRQLHALALLIHCAKPLMLASPETFNALLKFTRESVVPRFSAWMKAGNKALTTNMLKYMWCWTLVGHQREIFLSEDDESAFASELGAHMIASAQMKKFLSETSYVLLKAIMCAFSENAFELYASRILLAAKHRQSALVRLIAAVGARDEDRVVLFIRRNVLPLLTKENDDSEDSTWACEALEQCILSVSRAEVFLLAPTVFSIIKVLFTQLSSSGKLKSGRKLYCALFSALLTPRCEADRSHSDNEQRRLSHGKRGDAGLSSQQSYHCQKLGFVGSKVVSLAWEEPEEAHVEALVSFLNEMLGDALYLIDHLFDIDIKKDAHPETLRELVVEGSDALRRSNLSKPKASNTEGKKIVKKTKEDETATDSKDGFSPPSIPDVVIGLCTVISAIVGVNKAFFHLEPSPAARSHSSSSSHPQHWALMQRCNSLKAFLNYHSDSVTLETSLDMVFDAIEEKLLPLAVCGVPSFDNETLRSLLQEYLPMVPTIKEETANIKCLTSVLNILALLCDCGEKESYSTWAQENQELQKYFSSGYGERFASPVLYPVKYWMATSLNVYYTLERRFNLAISLDRKQKLVGHLLFFLFSSTLYVGNFCKKALLKLVWKTTIGHRRGMLHACADLMAAVATHLIASSHTSSVEMFAQLLADDIDGDMAANASPPSSGVASPTGDGEKGPSEGGLSLSKQEVSSMLSLLATWARKHFRFAVDEASVRVARLLLAFPSDLITPSTSALIEKELSWVIGSASDREVMWVEGQRLIAMAYRYSITSPSRACVVIEFASKCVLPWEGMRLKEATVHYLVRMVTGNAPNLRVASLCLLIALLQSTRQVRLQAYLEPFYGENHSRKNALYLSPAAIQEAQKRVRELREEFPMDVVSVGSTCFPRNLYFFRTRDPENFSLPAEKRRANASPEFLTYHWVARDAGKGRARSASSAEALQRVFEPFLAIKGTEEMQNAWLPGSWDREAGHSAFSYPNHIEWWHYLINISSINGKNYLFQICEGLKTLLQQCRSDLRSGPKHAVASAAAGTVSSTAVTTRDVLGHYFGMLQVVSGLLSSMEDEIGTLPWEEATALSIANRKKVFQIFSDLVALSLQVDAPNEMAKMCAAFLTIVHRHFTTEEVHGLLSQSFALLESGEQGAGMEQEGSTEDGRQSRLVSNILFHIASSLEAFAVKFNHELLQFVIQRFRVLPRSLWCGRTAMWRRMAMAAVRNLIRIPIANPCIGGEALVSSYLDEVTKAVAFPPAPYESNASAGASPNAVDENTLSRIRTFVSVAGSIPVEMLRDEKRLEMLTVCLLRPGEVKLSEVNDLAAQCDGELSALAAAHLPKAKVHALLEMWCKVLTTGVLPDEVHLLHRRSRCSLLFAVRTLLLTHLHRIGKFALMESVGMAVVQSMHVGDVRVRQEAQELFLVLTRVASMEQIDYLLKEYEANLKKTSTELAQTTQEGKKETDLRQRRTALVLTLCAGVLADPFGLPPYAPRVMQRLAPLASTQENVLEVRRVVKEMFETWWRSHQEQWEQEIKRFFTPAQIDLISPLLTAPAYFA